MTNLIEDIGSILGIAAFLGLSVLAFLIFQQAREVRRLRDWAGRAPERAQEAADATSAAAEARGDAAPQDREKAPSRFGAFAGRMRERVDPVWAELDRRAPFDPRYALAALAAAIVAAGALTSGFGLFAGDEDGAGKRAGKERRGGGGGGERRDKIEVSVLNATQDDTAEPVIAGVRGLADEVADEVVRPAGFDVAALTNAASGFPESVIMYEPAGEEAARELAEAASETLGETEVQPIVAEVADLAEGAAVVLVVGRDDAEALEPAAG